MAKQKYFEKAIQWARQRGITGIKANHDGFERPTSFTKVGDEEQFVPDVTGKRLGSKFYIEIATKTEGVQRKVSKWKLLSTLANLNGGKLILMTPRGHKAFVERQLEKYALGNTQLVYLPQV